MKLLFIEAKNKKLTDRNLIDSGFIAKLPREIFLVYSIQFKGQAEAFKKEAEKAGIKIRGFQSVLGCSKLKSEFPIILIGQGRFHALNLALQNNHPILVYSNGSSMSVGEKEIEEFKKKKSSGLNRFFSGANIGILVSAKPGQEQLKRAHELSKKINEKYPEKNVYLFLSNNINLNEFQNFKIDSWINSACPGLINDSNKIINIDDILEFL